MTTAAPTYQRAYARSERKVPTSQLVKVILALVLNTILFGLIVL